MYAVSTGKVTFVQEWIKQGNVINTVDKQGRNILHYCCGGGAPIPKLSDMTENLKTRNESLKQMSDFLIDNGINYNGKDKTGMTPIQYIVNVDVEKSLELHALETRNNAEIWKFIYSCAIFGTKPSQPLYGLTHVTVAYCFIQGMSISSKAKADQIKEIITNFKLNINETDGNGMTALHHLCYYEYDSEPYGLREVLVAKLLELGADPNVKDIRGYTPLMCAIEKGFVVIFEPNDPRSTNEQGIGRLLKAYNVNLEPAAIQEAFKDYTQKQEEINSETTKHFKDMEVIFQQEITEMKYTIEGLKVENEELKQTLNQNSEELFELKSEIKQLQDKQKDLVQEIDELKNKIEHPASVIEDAPTSSLLLCSVTLTDVCRHLETNVEVTCLPDASLEDLQAAISKDEQKYNNMYLVTSYKCIGTDIEILKHQYQEIIDSARINCTKITVASILPTLEDEEVNVKIKELNKALKDICKETGCEFVDNDHTFKYGDGTVIEGCFDEEGKLFSDFGIKRLLKNLGIFSAKRKTKATNI